MLITYFYISIYTLGSRFIFWFFLTLRVIPDFWFIHPLRVISYFIFLIYIHFESNFRFNMSDLSTPWNTCFLFIYPHIGSHFIFLTYLHFGESVHTSILSTLGELLQTTDDLFHPKTSTFSTRSCIWVHFKTVYDFSQPLFLNYFDI